MIWYDMKWPYPCAQACDVFLSMLSFHLLLIFKFHKWKIETFIFRAMKCQMATSHWFLKCQLIVTFHISHNKYLKEMGSPVETSQLVGLEFFSLKWLWDLKNRKHLMSPTTWSWNRCVQPGYSGVNLRFLTNLSFLTRKRKSFLLVKHIA